MSNYIIVSANYPPHVGGVERYSEAIANELAKRGNHVYVIASQYGNLPPEENISENLTLFRTPSIMLLEGRMPVILPSVRWSTIVKRIRHIENPRVIIQTFLYPLSYFARRLSSRMKWDCLIINHGANYVCQGKGVFVWAEHIYEETMARIVTRKTKGCYSVSKEAARWAGHFSIKTAGILHNGVNAAMIEEKLKTISGGVRERYDISKNTFMIAYIGRMIREKGIFQLIEAVQELLRENCDVALIAAGGGEELDVLRKNTVPGRIEFTGNISHDEVLRILRESDCCCLPSNSEGLPTVLLEAALADCFLICSPYGGSPEIVDNLGIVMKDNSRESIIKAILEAMRMDDRQSIIERSKEHVKRDFVWEKICDSIEAINWEI